MQQSNKLWQPLTLGGLTLPNRVVMGSMHTGLDGRDDGGAALAAFYRERAAHGVGFIVTGGIAINKEACGGPDYVVITDKQWQERMHAAVDAVHAEGGLIVAQLFHAGRYAVPIDGDASNIVAPSPIPWRAARGAIPREMTEDDIERTIRDFGAAASTAIDIGFDGVEIMASEGYLLNQFLASRTNHREDNWGGTVARRRAFPLAVATAVRAAVSEQHAVTVRISVDDLMDDASGASNQFDEAVAFANALVDIGVDGLSMGIGWHESKVPTVQAAIPKAPWTSYGQAVADAVHEQHPTIPFIATNRINSMDDAVAVLQSQAFAAVALARPLLADPRLVERWRSGETALVNPCIGCDQACLDRSLTFQPVSCLVNPRAGHEFEMPLERDSDIRRIAVVGGGPAGLAAAEDLMHRGHSVTLFEARPALGGQFMLAARVPGKNDYGAAVAAWEHRLHRGGVDIRVSTRPSADDLAKFDGVIVATGVTPREVMLEPVQGIHASDVSSLPTVMSYEAALKTGVPEGPVAIIGGGGIGVDVAATLVEPALPVDRAAAFRAQYNLADVAAVARATNERLVVSTPGAPRDGSLVTILRRHGKIGAGIGITSRWVQLAALRHAGVSMLTDLAYEGLIPGGLRIRRTTGLEDNSVDTSSTTTDIPAKTIVICGGQESLNPYEAALKARGLRFEVVGGAKDARRINAVRATQEGLRAARALTR